MYTLRTIVMLTVLCNSIRSARSFTSTISTASRCLQSHIEPARRRVPFSSFLPNPQISRRLCSNGAAFATHTRLHRSEKHHYSIRMMGSSPVSTAASSNPGIISTDTSRSTHDSIPSDADTIFALSSGPSGRAGVSVIRISGPGAKEALLELTVPGNNATVPPAPVPRRACVRKLFDPITKELLDESLVLWMPGPKSFTGEDTVELHTHGSNAVVSGVLAALGSLPGLRLAERGEFTSRAYGNGRMDLTSVEGLADLIAADTRQQRLQALRQMGGGLQGLYEGWRSILTQCLAHTEAVIDFGDDDDALDDTAFDAIRPKVSGLISELRRHLQDGRRGEIVRTGVRVAIAGPPNAGKSTLLNIVASRPAAIVSPIAGTTRDIVQVQLDVGGFPVILSDTAGLRELENASDDVEREGIRRAKEAVTESHLTIFVWDIEKTDEGKSALQSLLHDSSGTTNNMDNVILVANKADSANGSSTDINLLAADHQISDVWKVSCKTGDGIDAFLSKLESLIRERYMLEDDMMSDAPIITRTRHRVHVKACLEALQRSYNLPIDLAAEEFRLASNELGRITGAVGVEELLDVIFRDFCIGK